MITYFQLEYWLLVSVFKQYSVLSALGIVNVTTLTMSRSLPTEGLRINVNIGQSLLTKSLWADVLFCGRLGLKREKM